MVRRLKKVEIESMLNAYDTDPTAALSAALCQTLEVDEPSWDRLIRLAATAGPQRTALLARETAALDDLLKLLVENRSL